MSGHEEPILEIRDLHKYFTRNTGFLDSILGRGDEIQAVDGVSLELYRGESEGVIGESGCGKTTLLMTLMGLHDITGGEILYKGQPVSAFSKADWKAYRSDVQIVFQDPYNSLDPKMTVRESLREALRIHDMGDEEARIHSVLEQVELNPPGKYIDNLPKHLSGGEKQRVSIARSLIVEPEILLADEPVSMLDVSTQASILNLLSNLREELDLAMFYISHDLSTVAYVCDIVHIMYLGRIVETTPKDRLVSDPKHPYTKELIKAIPIPDPFHERSRVSIEGVPQEPVNLGSGCRFRDRCPERMDICEETPLFLEDEPGHEVACHLYYDHESYVSGMDAETANPVSQEQD